MLCWSRPVTVSLRLTGMLAARLAASRRIQWVCKNVGSESVDAMDAAAAPRLGVRRKSPEQAALDMGNDHEN